MKANADGVLIHIRNQTGNDQKIYKSFELESIFIEICNREKSNIIIGSIYKHPNMNINEFNFKYLNEFLDKLSKDNKSAFLLGDLNINFSNYHIHLPTNEFLDPISSHYFLSNNHSLLG